MTPGQFLEIFISVNLQATLFVALCYGLCRWIPCDRTRAKLWTCCHTGLLGLVLIGSSLPHLRIIQPAEVRTTQEILAAYHFQQTLGWSIAAIWGSGMVVSLAILARAGFRTMSILRHLQPLETSRLPIPQGEWRNGSVKQIRYFGTDSYCSPFCWQFQQPFMVLPNAVLQLQKHELEMILRHELAHLEHNHPLHAFIQRLVQAIFWFNPAIYWAGRNADVSREMMCDAIAANSREEITDYLRVLLKVIELPAPRPAGPCGLTLFQQRDPSGIVRRVRRLTERATRVVPQTGITTWSVAFLWLLLAAVTVTWVPVNALSSRRSYWSACPSWTAEVFHDFGVNARDYEVYEGRLQVFDDEPVQSLQVMQRTNVPAGGDEPR